MAKGVSWLTGLLVAGVFVAASCSSPEEAKAPASESTQKSFGAEVGGNLRKGIDTAKEVRARLEERTRQADEALEQARQLDRKAEEGE